MNKFFKNIYLSRYMVWDSLVSHFSLASRWKVFNDCNFWKSVESSLFLVSIQDAYFSYALLERMRCFNIFFVIPRTCYWIFFFFSCGEGRNTVKCVIIKVSNGGNILYVFYSNISRFIEYLPLKLVMVSMHL